MHGEYLVIGSVVAAAAIVVVVVGGGGGVVARSKKRGKHVQSRCTSSSIAVALTVTVADVTIVVVFVVVFATTGHRTSHRASPGVVAEGRAWTIGTPCIRGIRARPAPRSRVGCYTETRTSTNKWNVNAWLTGMVRARLTVMVRGRLTETWPCSDKRHRTGCQGYGWRWCS